MTLAKLPAPPVPAGAAAGNTHRDGGTHPGGPAGPAAPAARPVDVRVTALRRFALSITLFTVAGHALLGFEQSYLTPVVGVLGAYAVELLLETLEARVQRRRPRYAGGAGTLVTFLLPAHIAGLACAMLLYGNESLWPTAFAVTVAVASKYVIRVLVNGSRRHVLNPSNFGISVTLLLFGWVGIAPPYHFTENVTGLLDWLVPLAIGVSGTLLNGKLTGRMPLILAWVGGFAAQAVLRSLVLDTALVAALLPMTGVAFILYTNYMITDPGTTPASRRGQIAFGLATATTYGLLVTAHITFGLFFALTIVCAGRLTLILAGNAWRALRARRPARTAPPSPAAAGRSAGPASTPAPVTTPAPATGSAG